MNTTLKRTLLVVGGLLVNALLAYCQQDYTLDEFLADPGLIVQAFLVPNYAVQCTWLIYPLFPAFRQWVYETDEWIYTYAVPAIAEDAERRGFALSDETLEALADRILYLCKREYRFKFFHYGADDPDLLEKLNAAAQA